MVEKIEIVVNGEKKVILNKSNIKEMIKTLGYEDNSFAVVLNGTFVDLKKYDETKIAKGDTIEILAPMAGG